MREPAYAREPLHRFVKRYLAATGRPVIRQESHRFVVTDGEAEIGYTYSPATSDAAPDGSVTLIAPGGRLLERMFKEAQARGFAIRVRVSSPTGTASAAGGCLAYPECRSLAAEDCCEACPSHGSLLRVMLPRNGTASVESSGDSRTVLRCTFEIEIRGPEPLRELLVVDADSTGTVREILESEWEPAGDWTADPGLRVEPEEYDATVAHARSHVALLIEPWVALAAERAADRVAPALRSLRGRAVAERAEAPSEAKSIDAHLAREEAALIERHAVYVTTRLVNAAMLESTTPTLNLDLAGKSRVLASGAPCDACGRPTREALVDEALHVVCTDCATRCATCGICWCPDCAAQATSCGVCRLAACDSCATLCADCGGSACTTDTEACSACGRRVCYRCFGECAKDDEVLCHDHLLTCVGGEGMAPRHQIATVDAGIACEAHAHPCGHCADLYSEASLSKAVGGGWVCKKDRRRCARCPNMWHLPAGVVACSVGGELLCVGSHALACSVGDLACADHSTRCAGGHRVCRGHASACAIGGEDVCGTHALSCGTCSSVLCAAHAESCPACGVLNCAAEPRTTCEVCLQPSCPRCAGGQRCAACANLTAPPDGRVDQVSTLMAIAETTRLPTLVGIGTGRLVSVEHGLLRSTVLVIEAGVVKGRRTLGPLERRRFGL
jgi:hypothetical protein